MHTPFLGMLVITPLRATIHQSVSFLTEMSPYIRIKYGQKEYRTKHACSQGKNPKFIDTFEFQHVGQYQIEFELWDKNSVSADTFIGKAIVDISPVYSQLIFDPIVEFFKSGKSKGELFIHFEFKPVRHEVPNYQNGYINYGQPALYGQPHQHNPYEQFSSPQNGHYPPSSQHNVKVNLSHEEALRALEETFNTQETNYQQVAKMEKNGLKFKVTRCNTNDFLPE